MIPFIEHSRNDETIEKEDIVVIAKILGGSGRGREADVAIKGQNEGSSW